MAYTYHSFEDNIDPEPDISAYDPFAPRSSGALPEGFPIGLNFAGLIIDENMPPYNIAAQRPIRDVQVRTGLAVRRGVSLGALENKGTMLLVGAAVLGFFLLRKKKR